MKASSYCAEQVRLYDHDRFVTVIFAPAAARERLFALYAFNLEIAKTSEIVSESLIGQMRLQWWRDALDRLYGGGPIAHGVAEPLGRAIRELDLPRAAFDRMIDAREFDLDRMPPANIPALLGYAENTAAPLLELALRTVMANGCESDLMFALARSIGTAWALTGLLRAVPFHARQRRLYLPEDRLLAAKVQASRLFELKPSPGLEIVVREIAEHAEGLLATARSGINAVPRRARSPLLLAALCDIYLNDLRRAAWNPFALDRYRRPLIVVRLAFRRALGRY